MIQSPSLMGESAKDVIRGIPGSILTKRPEDSMDATVDAKLASQKRKLKLIRGRQNKKHGSSTFVGLLEVPSSGLLRVDQHLSSSPMPSALSFVS